MNRRNTIIWMSFLAATACPRGLTAQTQVMVKTVTVDGREGELRNFSLHSGLSLRNQPSVPAERVVRIFTNATGSTPSSKASRIDLDNGDRLFGQILGGNEDTITLGVSPLGNIRIPLTRILRVTTAEGRRAEKANDHAMPEKRTSGDSDVILLSNGDRIDGLVAEINKAKILLEQNDRATSVPMRSVLTVRFAPTDTPRPKGLRATLHLTDGSRITVEELTWTGPKLEARIEPETVELSVEAVRRVDISGGRWVWLSELEPVSFQHVPAFSLPWPWVRDRNVLGRPIRLRGRTYERGVGLHAEAVLIYDLGTAYERFVSEVGIDDGAGDLADVDIEVRLDGEIRFQQAHLRNGDEAKVDLPVREASRLELIVRFGANADIQDRVNWAGAALIRKPPTDEPIPDPDD